MLRIFTHLILNMIRLQNYNELKPVPFGAGFKYVHRFITHKIKLYNSTIMYYSLPFLNPDFADHKKRKQNNNDSSKNGVYTVIPMMLYGIVVEHVNYG